MSTQALLPRERIQTAMIQFRGHHVLIDEDLAALYGVTTKALVQAVGRNVHRFPEDFAFRLTAAEYEIWKAHLGVAPGRGGRRYPPYAFTEHGVAML